ncbi:MAG TPA: ECF-type sigma factor [Verrucomicrobiae bacterium]|nr:ECF-type sigma factor [Verrucomicrobiae bacterium]
MGDVTQILGQIKAGDSQASKQLMELVYGELRQLATAKMAREAANHTLQPTALVHEAWLRLGGDQQTTWHNRAHFFAAAAEAMRRILIDRARKRHALRRGGGMERVNLDELELAATSENDDRLLAVDEALEKLAIADPQKAQLVKLRYYSGLTIEQAAESLDISLATAKRWWTYARAWLFQEIKNSRGG